MLTMCAWLRVSSIAVVHSAVAPGLVTAVAPGLVTAVVVGATVGVADAAFAAAAVLET